MIGYCKPLLFLDEFAKYGRVGVCRGVKEESNPMKASRFHEPNSKGESGRVRARECRFVSAWRGLWRSPS